MTNIISNFLFLYRCFPQCCQIKGHRDSGFCGRSLDALIIITKSKMATFDPSKLYVIQDIHVSDEPKLHLKDRVNRNELVGLVKGENDSPGQYLYWQGKLRTALETDSRLEIQASFNSRLRSWDYDWNSNRWRGEKLHVVQVYVLFEVQPNVLEVIGTVAGPEFQITSNKTQSMRNKVDKAALLANNLRGVSDGTISGSMSNSTHTSPAKKAKLLSQTQKQISNPLGNSFADMVFSCSGMTNPYLEYLSAAESVLRSHQYGATNVDGRNGLTTSSSTSTVPLLSSSSQESVAATKQGASPANTVDLARSERSSNNVQVQVQAKALREAMSLEDVSLVLMSLKSCGSGLMYSSAALVNPTAYTYDVNRLITMHQGSSESARTDSQPSTSALKVDAGSSTAAVTTESKYLTTEVKLQSKPAASTKEEQVAADGCSIGTADTKTSSTSGPTSTTSTSTGGIQSVSSDILEDSRKRAHSFDNNDVRKQVF